MSSRLGKMPRGTGPMYNNSKGENHRDKTKHRNRGRDGEGTWWTRYWLMIMQRWGGYHAGQAANAQQLDKQKPRRIEQAISDNTGGMATGNNGGPGMHGGRSHWGCFSSVFMLGVKRGTVGGSCGGSGAHTPPACQKAAKGRTGHH